MGDSTARFSIVIPHFYDSEVKWTPLINYNGISLYPYTHLLKILEQREASSVIIMSYRNFFEKTNGTKEISENEIQEATEGEYSTKIIIAQETGNVDPDYITFYDYPKISLFDALQEIDAYFGKYKNFDGVAVHYFDSFLRMDQ